ncbi:uncharacterized protein METZ01_LOCUS495668, partial [marine metagenome]
MIYLLFVSLILIVIQQYLPASYKIEKGEKYIPNK